MPLIELELEYQINCPAHTLYEFISTASGLGEWFADHVTEHNNIFTFEWDGSKERAELLEKTENEYVLFKWLDREEAYFEFGIETNNITNDTILVVFDNVESSEENSQIKLWDSQISELKHRLGS